MIEINASFSGGKHYVHVPTIVAAASVCSVCLMMIYTN